MSARRKGLRWERTADAVREFVRTYGQPSPRRALFCTFDFDPAKFNSILLPQLTRRGRQFRSLVIADAGALQAKLRCLAQPVFGRYAIVPAKCRNGGVFHPKLVLLRSGDHFLIGIGSANLTPGGLGGNLELMFFADHTTDEGRSLAQGAASFLTRLIGCTSVVLSDASRRFVKTLLSDMSAQPGVILDTLDEALLPQMAKHRKRACGKYTTALTVLSPWHSGIASPDQSDPAAVALVRKHLGVTGSISVFTQGEGGYGPDLGKNVEVLIPRVASGNGTPNADEDDEQVFDRRPSTVHAKAYLCRGHRGNVLFFGSANCTIPALARPVSQGGNVELLVATQLTNADAATFEGDLQEMFALAEAKQKVSPLVKPASPQGIVLEGHLIGQSGRTALRIEAPGVRRGTTVITSKRASPKTVKVVIRDGIGTVVSQITMRDLFPGSLPSRSDDCWSSVLWERQGRKWIPFPVVIPSLEPVSGQPGLALVEILEEECGWWPPSRSGDEPKPDENDVDDPSDADDEDNQDGDKELWTEAEHQGELDRIAVAVSLLRKRVLDRCDSPKAVRQYIDLLLTRIEATSLEPHLAFEVQRFLRKRPAHRSKKR